MFGTLGSAAAVNVGNDVTALGSIRVGSMSTGGAITVGGNVLTTQVASVPGWAIDVNGNMDGNITITGGTNQGRPIRIGGDLGVLGQLQALLFGNVQIDGNFAGAITATGGAPGVGFSNILAVIGALTGTVTPDGTTPAGPFPMAGQGGTYAFDIIQKTAL